MARYRKKGKTISNGVLLEMHENDTIVFLNELGYNIELIPPSNVPGYKNPDLIMKGLVWEMKAPKGRSRNNISHIFKKATHQSENLIMDFRRYDRRKVRKAIQNAITRFNASNRVKRLYIITENSELIKLTKKS